MADPSTIADLVTNNSASAALAVVLFWGLNKLIEQIKLDRKQEVALRQQELELRKQDQKNLKEVFQVQRDQAERMNESAIAIVEALHAMRTEQEMSHQTMMNCPHHKDAALTGRLIRVLEAVEHSTKSH